jgi:hypothetical protein
MRSLATWCGSELQEDIGRFGKISTGHPRWPPASDGLGLDSKEQETMHLHQNRLHPDWIARLEMFRQFAAHSLDEETVEPAPAPDTQETLSQRWPLPKISYRHRKTAAPRPR